VRTYATYARGNKSGGLNIAKLTFLRADNGCHAILTEHLGEHIGIGPERCDYQYVIGLGLKLGVVNRAHGAADHLLGRRRVECLHRHTVGPNDQLVHV
jgi:hypothetical protein